VKFVARMLTLRPGAPRTISSSITALPHCCVPFTKRSFAFCKNSSLGGTRSVTGRTLSLSYGVELLEAAPTRGFPIVRRQGLDRPNSDRPRSATVTDRKPTSTSHHKSRQPRPKNLIIF
jgi:hypothetical protein